MFPGYKNPFSNLSRPHPSQSLARIYLYPRGSMSKLIRPLGSSHCAEVSSSLCGFRVQRAVFFPSVHRGFPWKSVRPSRTDSSSRRFCSPMRFLSPPYFGSRSNVFITHHITRSFRNSFRFWDCVPKTAITTLRFVARNQHSTIICVITDYGIGNQWLPIMINLSEQMGEEVLSTLGWVRRSSFRRGRPRSTTK